MGDGPIPSFNRPPVIETVMGVQFPPLSRWLIPHFGLYWQRVRDRFPKIEVRPPIATLLGEEITQIEFAQSPEVRCLFIAEDESELLQVQNDRFLTNWRATPKSFPYPRYQLRIRPFFFEQWEIYKGFLRDENMGEIVPLQCEITYINHIPRGDSWEVAADWSNIFTVCGTAKGEVHLPAPVQRRFSFNYDVGGAVGTLFANASRIIRARDGTEAIQFQITVRGRPPSIEKEPLEGWFDAAHAWVVKGFAELTTNVMHKYWERQQ
jgi:uncharacterized protein (TIGR04255 family)